MEECATHDCECEANCEREHWGACHLQEPFSWNRNCNKRRCSNQGSPIQSKHLIEQKFL